MTTDWLQVDLLAVEHSPEQLEAALLDAGALAITMLDAADAPCAPVNALEEVLEDPQVAAAGSLFTVEHPDAGRLRQPRPPVRQAEERTADFVRRPAPALGADGAEVLGEAGFEADEIAALRQRGVLA